MRNLKIAQKKLDKIAAEIGNGKIRSRTLIRKLNKEFKSLKVRFSTRHDPKMYKSITCEGLYNGRVKDQYDAIYSIIIIKDTKEVWIKPRRHAFFMEMYLILAHEFRHGYQDRRRKYRVNIREKATFHHFNKYVRDDVRYLIDYDEVDAYAFETAEELRLNGLSISDLQTTSVYRTMYGKKIKKYAHKHYKRWVRKVFNHINKKTIKRTS
jgi:hypothetical protein